MEEEIPSGIDSQYRVNGQIGSQYRFNLTELFRSK